ncbi:MAG TPA: penicillin-binding protein [Candidatus Mediterraneibacter caccogallinarum]|nr:penicillin-binding protein [Candidatus Mediterraneibacter caccogallinarum]
MRSRLITLIIVFCITSSILIGRLFYLQIVRGEDYLANYELQIRKTQEVAGTRGNIYDRNGKLLAYNELAYSVTIEDTITANTRSEKNKQLNAVLDKVLSIVESHGDSVIDSFGIILDSAGTYQFTQSSETQRLRFVADVYGQRTIDTLNEEQRNQSAADIIHYLCTDDVNGYGLDDSTLDPAYILKMINMRYAMGLNSYQQYIATTLASDVSDETAAAIMENKDTLTGVDIAEDSLRRYTDGIYFASIIGYTGQISQDEYDALSDEDKKKYSLSDIVGKSGLEQTFDSVLQGTKGETTVYVDNLGKVTDTVSIREPEAGNDVYLTIDKDLQEYTYKLLEEKLAGIILSKLRNVINYDPANEASSTDIIIPVGDAYHSLIANSVVDATHFSSADAKPAEQAVYAAFQAKKTDTLAQIMADMQSSTTAPYNQLSEEMQDYMDYIVDDVLKDYTGLLMTDKIDTSDETYTAWTRDETINVYTFLNYAITQNWIDTSKLESDSYSSSEEIYASLLNYLQDYLSEDSEFDKLLYEYLIKSGSISGAQICAILYEQGVLPMDEASYNGLLSGSVDAYSWLYGKIASLEITPGQLALEPCSAGAVVSDPNTGEVLACVSYPGYDNNRLANTMDSSYYRQLNTGLARTFYNRATQEKTAPGSTYKMVSSVAGLTEGIINGNTTFYCDGIFTNVTPSPRCWNRSGHGSLNVVRALQVSCNEFFYNVGYDLGLDANGNYDSDLGIEKLAKYASMFGLNEKSGVEIPESSPEISDQYAVQSAIGQGTNNYTVSQLNRYVAAVANRGTVYDLTLVDKTTDSSGKLIKEYEPEVVNTMDEVSSTTWDLVHEGMIRMVENSSTFTSLDMSIAGKTGTAQQSETSPDHALFVGFAPSDTPEIAIAVRIANGYNSSYPSEIGRDIVKIYFGLEDAEELVKGQAAELGQANAGD